MMRTHKQKKTNLLTCSKQFVQCSFLTSANGYFYFPNAFSNPAKIKNIQVTRITQNVNMFGFPEYVDTTVLSNIKTLHRYLKMWEK